jgi:hypothetical protein
MVAEAVSATLFEFFLMVSREREREKLREGARGRETGQDGACFLRLSLIFFASRVHGSKASSTLSPQHEMDALSDAENVGIAQRERNFSLFVFSTSPPSPKKLINALLHLPVAGCPRPRDQSVQGLVLGRGVRVANGRGEDVTCFVRRGQGDESFVFTAVRQHRVEVSRQTKRLAWDAFQERGALLGASLSVALDVSSSRPSAPPLQLKE